MRLLHPADSAGAIRLQQHVEPHQAYSATAEFEREQIKERVNAGMAAAKARGKQSRSAVMR